MKNIFKYLIAISIILAGLYCVYYLYVKKTIIPKCNDKYIVDSLKKSLDKEFSSSKFNYKILKIREGYNNTNGNVNKTLCYMDLEITPKSGEKIKNSGKIYSKSNEIILGYIIESQFIIDNFIPKRKNKISFYNGNSNNNDIELIKDKLTKKKYELLKKYNK